MLDLKNIKRNQLCLGCGLCESLAADARMMVDKEGFIVPDADLIDGNAGMVLRDICPAVNIDCIKPVGSCFGQIESVYEGWAVDPEIRHRASSGGIITAACCFLLESKKVDGIIQVRRSPGHYMHNEMHVSATRCEVMEAAASRYAPVSIFREIRQLLEKDSSDYAFVGKPCDVMTISRFLNAFPEYKDRIKYKISLVCAGTPSFNATATLIKRGMKSASLHPVDVRYRGNGWPGKFAVRYDDDSCYELDYNESWGAVLGRNLNFRCKICPDGIGQYADIVVGDSWSTKDGYPDFSEQDGRSFILSRTSCGEELIAGAAKSDYISVRSLDLDRLKEMQPYQYQRLQYASYKLTAAKVCIGRLIRIKNTHFSLFTLIRGFRSMVGTVKRFKRHEHTL